MLECMRCRKKCMPLSYCSDGIVDGFGWFLVVVVVGGGRIRVGLGRLACDPRTKYCTVAMTVQREMHAWYTYMSMTSCELNVRLMMSEMMESPWEKDARSDQSWYSIDGAPNQALPRLPDVV